MAKKSREQRKKATAKTSVQPSWGDLKQMKDKVAETVSTQVAILGEVLDKFKEKHENNPELQKELIGIYNSYNDVMTDMKKTMQIHMIFDKDPETGEEIVVGSKKGTVKTDTEEYMGFLQAAGGYMDLEQRVMGIMAHTNLSLFDKLGVYNKEEYTQLENTFLAAAEATKEMTNVTNQALGKGESDGKSE